MRGATRSAPSPYASAFTTASTGTPVLRATSSVLRRTRRRSTRTVTCGLTCRDGTAAREGESFIAAAWPIPGFEQHAAALSTPQCPVGLPPVSSRAPAKDLGRSKPLRIPRSFAGAQDDVVPAAREGGQAMRATSAFGTRPYPCRRPVHLIDCRTRRVDIATQGLGRGTPGGTPGRAYEHPPAGRVDPRADSLDRARARRR